MLSLINWIYKIFALNGGSPCNPNNNEKSWVTWASLGGSLVKNLPAKQEMRVQPLGWEDPLEKGMSTHSSILSWRIPWTQEPGGQSMG